jgi:hypothetical protein
VNHHDLPTFLDYVSRTGLDIKSTVYVGTHYEYTVASSLAKYGFSLKRVGGSSDYGIDLLGVWDVPSMTDSIKVLVQCKAGSQRVGPHMIRELEGAFVGAPVGWRGTGVLGFLASEGTATKGVRESLGRSRWPMGFISCSNDGYVSQMLWNRRAEEVGLVGLGVGMRYPERKDEKPQLSMSYQGNNLPFVEP